MGGVSGLRLDTGRHAKLGSLDKNHPDARILSCGNAQQSQGSEFLDPMAKTLQQGPQGVSKPPSDT